MKAPVVFQNIATGRSARNSPRTEPKLSGLDDLFPQGARGRAENAVLHDRHTLQRLDDLYGDRRVDVDATHRASDRRELVALVSSAVADSQPLSASPPVGGGAPRRRQRIDVLGAVTAAAAVVALVAAGIVGGVQVATASPASDALRVLTADEATIASAAEGADAARDRLVAQIADADRAADELRAALALARTVPDPASGISRPSGSTVSIADEAALDAFLKRLDAYHEKLGAIEIPAIPAAYQRAPVDEGSLSQVGSAIDAAQLHLSEIDAMTAELRAAREAARAQTDAFAAEAAEFSRSYGDAAQQLVDGHLAAGEDVRAAVVEAAATIAQEDLLGEGGAQSLEAYTEAVSVMLEENLRVLLEREEREREERESQTVAPTPTQPELVEPTDPPAEPVTPTEPTDPPTEPDPSDAG